MHNNLVKICVCLSNIFTVTILENKVKVQPDNDYEVGPVQVRYIIKEMILHIVGQINTHQQSPNLCTSLYTFTGSRISHY